MNFLFEKYLQIKMQVSKAEIDDADVVDVADDVDGDDDDALDCGSDDLCHGSTRTVRLSHRRWECVVVLPTAQA